MPKEKLIGGLYDYYGIAKVRYDSTFEWRQAALHGDFCAREQITDYLYKYTMKPYAPVGYGVFVGPPDTTYFPNGDQCGSASTQVAPAASARFARRLAPRAMSADASATCGENTGTPGSGSVPPADEPLHGCVWVRDFVIYTDLSWDWLGPWYQDCGVAAASVHTTPASTTATALPVGADNCTVIGSTNTDVATMSNSGVLTAGTQSGRGHAVFRCSTRVVAAPLSASTALDAPTPGSTSQNCAPFYWDHKGADGTWASMGQKCLQLTSAGSPTILASLDPNADALTPAFVPPSSACAPSSPTMCDIYIVNADVCANANRPFQGGFAVFFGGTSSMPKTATWRYNGTVVAQQTLWNYWDGGNAPSMILPNYWSWSTGQTGTVTLTISDATGVSLTKSLEFTLIGFDADPFPADCTAFASSPVNDEFLDVMNARKRAHAKPVVPRNPGKP